MYMDSPLLSKLINSLSELKKSLNEDLQKGPNELGSVATNGGTTTINGQIGNPFGKKESKEKLVFGYALCYCTRVTYFYEVVSMSEINIERGIPVPENVRLAQRWPFKSLGSGDSFRVRGQIGTARNQCSRYGKRLGVKFICRVEGEGYVRVWRVD